MSFKEIPVKELQFNPFTKVGKEWMLVTAGTEDAYNTMTASWGGLGYFLDKPAATIYLRPQRHTKTFVDAAGTFTLSFYDEKYRSALNVCGMLSGIDVPDKAENSGLTPYFVSGTTAFQEADMIFVCKKILHTNLHAEDFYAPRNIDTFFPNRDFHTLYISEIVKVLVKE